MVAAPLGRLSREWAGEFLQHLAVEKGRSRLTLDSYRRDLARFARFLSERGLEGPEEASPSDVEDFIVSLRKEGLSARSVSRALSALRSFYEFAIAEGISSSNPAREVAGPHSMSPLPKALSKEEIERLIESIDGPAPADIRDRAIVEVLYSTGARISEIAALDLGDIDLENELVRIVGKGNKQRIVPLGSHARAALERYLSLSRPVLVERASRIRAPAALFVNARGQRLTRQGLWSILKRRASRVGLGEELSPHILRHSCATHMLEGGADIRAVQEMLGHASLTTTQTYTKITFSRIKSVYRSTHPRSGNRSGSGIGRLKRG